MPEYSLEELLEAGKKFRCFDPWCTEHPKRFQKLFRWRGRLNWKDIVERIIAGVIAGGAAGSTFFILDRIF